MSGSAPQTWEPDRYLAFADQRLRPALDLLARVPLDGATHVTDLGCGTGSVTPHLRQRFAQAELIALDRSPEMLEAARSAHRGMARWLQGDAALWQPAQLQDLIYSNAALHWLDGHDTLFPRLMGFVRPGGVLAVQMPNQFFEPSHALMREVAQGGPWADVLRPLLRVAPVAEAEQYYDWLAPLCQSIDIWHTTYMQALSGDDRVLEWISSTALKPLLEALRTDHLAAFRATLADKLREAYPRRADGTTLFPFKRLFIVAVRKA